MCCGHKTYGSILSLWTVSFSLFRSTNYGTSRTQIFVGLVHSIFWRQAKTFVTEAGYVINQCVYNKTLSDKTLNKMIPL